MFTWLPRKAWNTVFRDLVRNDPPLMSAVKPSARSLNGKMDQSEYNPTRSMKLGFVVLLMPKNLEWILFIIARAMPLRTTSRKKSIRKKKKAPPIVLSSSAMK